MIESRSSGRPRDPASEYGVSRPFARCTELAAGIATSKADPVVVCGPRSAIAAAGTDLTEVAMPPRVAPRDIDDTRANRTSDRTHPLGPAGSRARRASPLPNLQAITCHSSASAVRANHDQSRANTLAPTPITRSPSTRDEVQASPNWARVGRGKPKPRITTRGTPTSRAARATTDRTLRTRRGKRLMVNLLRSRPRGRYPRPSR